MNEYYAWTGDSVDPDIDAAFGVVVLGDDGGEFARLTPKQARDLATELESVASEAEEDAAQVGDVDQRESMIHRGYSRTFAYGLPAGRLYDYKEEGTK